MELLNYNDRKIQTKSINSPREDFVRGMLEYTCIHCSLVSKSAPNISRYHNDNCKYKKEVVNG